MKNWEMIGLNIAITIKIIMIFIALILIIFLTLPLIINDRTDDKVTSNYNTITKEEIDEYNAKIEPYISDNTKGSEVILLIDTIISMNQENAGDQGEFIGIIVESITNYTEDENLNQIAAKCAEASIHPMPDGTEAKRKADNNIENVHNAVLEMQELKSKIDTQKSYKVTGTKEFEKYTWVTIEEINKKDE